MKNIEELKKYYLDNKIKFESSNVFSEQTNNLNIFKEEYPLEKFSDLSLS